MNGFLLIDKDKGMTSFEVVRAVRRLSDVKKVGHAGTLDSLATGLLVIALGEGTKLLEYFIGCEKEYEVVAHFGAVSSTYDLDGEIMEGDSTLQFNQAQIENCILESFTGEILQVPPKYSALKIAGKRASDRVRAGEEVEMKPRKITIKDFKVLAYDWPRVRFFVECSSGTYVRSLINDLGEKLGCGAYVEELRRLKVGHFCLDKAVNLESLNKNIEQSLVSLEDAVTLFEKRELTDSEMLRLKDGRTLLDNKIVQEEPIMAFYKGKLVGILKNVSGDGIKFVKMIF